MTGTEGGWSPHPDAIHGHANAIDDPGNFPPVQPGRVVGLGAVCDFGPERYDDQHSQHFSVSEFVTLEDGRRVILHADRGFTIGWRSSGRSGSAHETRESITRDVLTTVLPDDDECGEDHPWSWLADLARARGLNVTAEDLRGLPYDVILNDNVIRWLASA